MLLFIIFCYDLFFVTLVIEAFLHHLGGESLLADAHLDFRAEFVVRLVDHSHRHAFAGGYGAVACCDLAYFLTVDFNGIAMTRDRIAFQLKTDNTTFHACGFLRSESLLADKFRVCQA